MSGCEIIIEILKTSSPEYLQKVQIIIYFIEFVSVLLQFSMLLHLSMLSQFIMLLQFSMLLHLSMLLQYNMLLQFSMLLQISMRLHFGMLLHCSMLLQVSTPGFPSQRLGFDSRAGHGMFKVSKPGSQ